MLRMLGIALLCCCSTLCATVNIMQELAETKKQMLTVITQAQKANQVVSAKLYLNFGYDGKSWKRDYPINNKGQPFSQSFLADRIHQALADVGRTMATYTAKEFSITWEALLKEKTGAFFNAQGSRKATNDKTGSSADVTEGSAEISFEHVSDFINLVLKRMGRENKPQLDSKGNFQ